MNRIDINATEALRKQAIFSGDSFSKCGLNSFLLYGFDLRNWLKKSFLQGLFLYVFTYTKNNVIKKMFHVLDKVISKDCCGIFSSIRKFTSCF